MARKVLLKLLELFGPGVANPAPEGLLLPADVKSSFASACNFQIIPNTLIGWYRCVCLGLVLNFSPPGVGLVIFALGEPLIIHLTIFQDAAKVGVCHMTVLDCE